jgi:hypothetical protein
MKRIEISEIDIGKCTIESNRNIPVSNEFAIKSLAAIQLLLLEADARTDPKTKVLVNTLQECAEKVADIYKDSGEIDAV